MSLAIGIDVGTSGSRAAAVARDGALVAIADAPIEPPRRSGSRREQDPWLWWRSVESALGTLCTRIDPGEVDALAVDGTSGTVLAVDQAGEPLASARMYDDAGAVEAASRIAAIAPETSGAHGPTSGLAKAVELAAETRPAHILHQADWIAGRLCGRFDVTDENNALKTGYDPVGRRWPDWMAELGFPQHLLPEVREPGSVIAPLTPDIARRFGFRTDAVVVAGTTDGCASFLATGADQVGDAVTALGSTLTLKILSAQPIFAPVYGVYSHRIGDMWLAGGASNTGGGVIAAYFDSDALTALEPQLRPDRETGLDYYPLLKPGERFPAASPGLMPRLTPRPESDAVFLQGILEGITRIEAEGYARLAQLGAPFPRRILTVGGGARNAAWATIRQRLIGAPVAPAEVTEAAVGAARLAWRAMTVSGA